MGAWQKAMWLTRGGRWALGVRMLALLLRLPKWLEARPLAVVLQALSEPVDRAGRYDTEAVLKLADALVARLRRTRPSPCLYRSLLLFRFLPEAGALPTIHFGVRGADGALVGHSWITANGQPVADDPDWPAASFRELYSFSHTRQ